MDTERQRPKVPEKPLPLKFANLFFEIERRNPNIPDPYEGYPNGFIFLVIFAAVLFAGGVLIRLV
jgi:hypothetical protein